jgi:ABC-type uncharacterized transport system substrate-binding protein
MRRIGLAVLLALSFVLAPRVAVGDSRPGIPQVGFLTTFSSANDRRFEAFKQKLHEPIGTGLVTSLGRPGGNLTGLSIQATDATGKRLERLRAVLPKASRVAVLWNATYSSKAIEFRETQQAARSLNITLQSVELRSPRDFDGGFVAIAREKPDALITLSDGPLTLRHQREIVAFSTKHRLPMVSETAEFAEAGGLMTYGASLTALFRRAATYVDIKILQGAKPADLPVEQPAKFELVINLKTAKTFSGSCQATFL